MVSPGKPARRGNAVFRAIAAKPGRLAAMVQLERWDRAAIAVKSVPKGNVASAAS
jgi:hypothetical protein